MTRTHCSCKEHPEFLETQEDYDDAPTGTIVACNFSDPWVKDYMGFWLCGSADEAETSSVMVRLSRRVLRWGETL